MTAPTPPPPHRGPSSRIRPRALRTHRRPAAEAHDGAAEPAEPVYSPQAREAREALPVAAAAAAAGVLLGLLWLQLAPRVPLVSDGEAVYLRNTEGEEAVAADGTFALLALAVGALTGAAAFLLRRRGGVGTVLGLAAGALLGSVLAWRLGVWLGPSRDVAAQAREVGAGEVFDAPLQLRAKSALLVWPAAALATHLLLTALFGPRDPQQPPPGREAPPGTGDGPGRPEPSGG